MHPGQRVLTCLSRNVVPSSRTTSFSRVRCVIRLVGKLCFFDNFRPLYGFSAVPFQGYFSIRKRQIMLPCVRICFLAAPFYGSSHNEIGSYPRLCFHLILVQASPVGS